MVKLTLPIQDQKTLTAAQGYLELAMPREALAELAGLSDEAALSHPGLEMRIVILLKLHRWKTAAACARKLCRLLPEQPAGFIHLAFCLHELGETAQARDILRKAPATVRKDATCCYNLACYECLSGNLDEAKRLITEDLATDPEKKERALSDEDLAAIRDYIASV